MNALIPVNLVFDLGQVMIRWEPVALVRQFFPNRCGTDAQAQELAHACFRSPAWSAFDAGLSDTDGVAQQLALRIKEPLPKVRAMVVDIAHALTPIAASVALLQQRCADQGNFVLFGSDYQDVFAFMVLIAVLVLRPSGLLGERVGERA